MSKQGFTTRLVHADRRLNAPEHGAVHQPTNNSVLFEYQDVNDLIDVFQGKKIGHVYSRSSSSSATALQNILNDMEQGIGALTFSTGMAAISSVMLALLRSGDHLIASQYLFGNTRSFIETLGELGIEVSLVDVTDSDAVAKVLRPNTRMLFTETIANPVTQVADLKGLGKLCKSQSLLYVVDNTMTPAYLFSARSIGASLIVQSLTKYVAGHGNVLGGALIETGLYDWSQYDNIAEIYRVADSKQWGMTQIKKRGLRDMGATLAPEAASNISIGLETMALRMDRCCSNAMALATYLQSHPAVQHVYYPGLTDHPQHVRASELFKAFGGILSIDLMPGIDCNALLNNLQLVITATHLGDTRTLALPVAPTIFFENGLQERQKMGISESMIRISVGIEDIDDIIADFDQAFETVE